MDISERDAHLETEEQFFKKWSDWNLVESALNACLKTVADHDLALLEDNTGER